MKKLFAMAFFMSTLFSYAQNWQAHFNDAKDLAQKQQKNILLIFSGSDWCAPCIKLDQNIWQSEVFKKEAEKSWILYKADFPKKKNNKFSVEKTQENGELAEKYNKNGIFPLVIILNPEQKVMGTMGFENIPPENYIEKLLAFSK